MEHPSREKVKTWIITIIIACLGAAAMLSLWPGGTLKPSLTNRFENVLARPLKLKAPGGVYDTTDHFLKPLQIPRPSETLSKAMAEIPTDDAVLFITAGDDEESELIYRTVSYLGWPRRIGEVRCGGTRAHTEAPFLPPAGEPVKWLMFYRILPPPELTQAAKKIGPRLALISASELKEWKSYCSP
jgi:hypothetical protein